MLVIFFKIISFLRSIMSILDYKKFKLYAQVAKQFSKLDISWQEFAKIDSELTQKWINTNLVSAHGLNLDISLRKAFLCDVKIFFGF